MIEYDVVVIGSGIAGMTSAIYLKRAGLKTLIIENNAPGGQLTKGFEIENYPGFLNINSIDLSLNIYNQVNNLEVDYLMEEIKEIDLKTKEIHTTNEKIKSKYIIIATGRREQKLNLENEEKLIGKGISFCATCDGGFYKGLSVVVVGGSNTAVTEALYLANICKEVTIIYRKEELRAEHILINRLEKYKNIKIIYNRNIKKYNIEKEKLVSVTLDNNEEVKCNGLFLAIGFIPNTELFDLKKENGYILVDEQNQTSIENVYACGDVIKKAVYQLTTATSDATITATNIIKNYNENFQ